MERTYWGMAEPSEWLVDGHMVKLLFTLRAAARLESRLGKSYEDIIFEMLQTDAQGSKLPPMTLERQAQVVLALMEEAGEQVTLEQLLGMHMQAFSALARAAQAEMLLKVPRGGKKKEAAGGRGAGRGTSTRRRKSWG